MVRLDSSAPAAACGVSITTNPGSTSKSLGSTSLRATSTAQERPTSTNLPYRSAHNRGGHQPQARTLCRVGEDPFWLNRESMIADYECLATLPRNPTLRHSVLDSCPYSGDDLVDEVPGHQSGVLRVNEFSNVVEESLL